MSKIKEQINYGGRRERMDPNLERKLRAGSDVYSSNPAMKKGAEDVQRLVSSRFNNVVDQLKRVTGIDDLSSNNVKQMLMGEMMSATNQVMRLESSHKEELKDLAKRTSFNQTGADENWYDVIAYLNEDRIDTSDFRYSPDDNEDDEEDEEEDGENKLSFNSFDIEDLTYEEELELEKHKRHIVNALIQGSAKKGHYAFQKPEVKRELDQINPQLFPLYNKIMSINDYFYFTMEQMIEMMAETGSGIAGKVDIDGGGDDDDSGDDSGDEGYEDEGSKPKIKAWGMIFPILVHEIVKGIESLIGRYSYPSNPEMIPKVLGQTDLLSNEPMQLRIGPEMVDKFRMALPDEMFESENEVLMPWFKMELYKIDKKEFLSIMADVISEYEDKNKKAAKRFEEILKIAKESKEEYENSKKSDDDDDINDEDFDNFLGGFGLSRS